MLQDSQSALANAAERQKQVSVITVKIFRFTVSPSTVQYLKIPKFSFSAELVKTRNHTSADRLAAAGIGIAQCSALELN